MAEVWIRLASSKVKGPFQDARVRQGLTSGEIPDDASLGRSPNGPWISVLDVKAGRKASGAAPSAAPEPVAAANKEHGPQPSQGGVEDQSNAEPSAVHPESEAPVATSEIPTVGGLIGHAWGEASGWWPDFKSITGTSWVQARGLKVSGQLFPALVLALGSVMLVAGDLVSDVLALLGLLPGEGLVAWLTGLALKLVFVVLGFQLWVAGVLAYRPTLDGATPTLRGVIARMKTSAGALALLGLLSIGGVVVDFALDILAGKSKGKESFVWQVVSAGVGQAVWIICLIAAVDTVEWLSSVPGAVSKVIAAVQRALSAAVSRRGAVLLALLLITLLHVIGSFLIVPALMVTSAMFALAYLRAAASIPPFAVHRT